MLVRRARPSCATVSQRSLIGSDATSSSSRWVPWRAKAVLNTLHTHGRRGFSEDSEMEKFKWAARYPPRYFDFKAFREGLKDKKRSLSEAELREVRREYALPPPEGWTVLDFLKHMKFGENAEDVANLFERWEDFISMNARDIRRISEITVDQRRRLIKFIALYNHGLWPRVSATEFEKRFGGTKLAREEEPWSEQEEKRLLELAEEYDVSFGDPWIYISWMMQRREDDVRDRYIDLVVKPRERESTFELAITKSSRPLLMNRKFRMMPMDLFIVPSTENFRLVESKFRVPSAFAKYRQDDIF